MGVQVNSPMPIVLETQSRILLRHNQKAALAVGLGMLAAAVAAVVLIPGGPKLLFGGVFGLFALIVLIFAFYRDELLIDLGGRQWRRSNGFVGRVEETRGALDEIPEVELTLKRSSGDDSPKWDVSIQAPRWKSAVILESHAREESGYAALEKWSTKLRRDALDRSGQNEVRTAWDALNKSLRDRALRGEAPAAGFADQALAAAFGPASASASPHPPAGSRIVITRESGRQRIVLPPMGWNSGATFMTLFGLCFGGFGTVAALVGLHVITGVRVNGRMPDGPVWGFAAAAAFFAFIGYGMIAAMVVGSRAREFVEDAHERLLVGNTWGGLTWGEKRLAKREIEGVDLSASPTSAKGMRAERDPHPPRTPTSGTTDVRIRTDARVLRVGRYLPEPDQRWLRDTLEGMARS
jgi:hypothetical protein